MSRCASVWGAACAATLSIGCVASTSTTVVTGSPQRASFDDLRSCAELTMAHTSRGDVPELLLTVLGAEDVSRHQVSIAAIAEGWLAEAHVVAFDETDAALSRSRLEALMGREARFYEHDGVDVWSAGVEAADVSITIELGTNEHASIQCVDARPHEEASATAAPFLRAWPDWMPPGLDDVVSGYVATTAKRSWHEGKVEGWEADLVDAPADLLDTYFASHDAGTLHWSATVARTVRQGGSVFTLQLDSELRDGARHLTVTRSGGGFSRDPSLRDAAPPLPAHAKR